MGLANVALLESFSSSVLTFFSTNPACTATGTSPQDCFNTLLTFDISALVIFPIGIFGILFGGFFGVFFEYLPGHGYRIRAVAMGLGLLIFLLFFGLAGLTVDQTEKSILDAFDSVAMIAYSIVIASFYRRYTREVEFESPAPDRLKILVDGKNVTDKLRTYSLHSTHIIKAPSESGNFREWLVSGGVSVLDSKSFETTMRVDGDGLLKIS